MNSVSPLLAYLNACLAGICVVSAHELPLNLHPNGSRLPPRYDALPVSHSLCVECDCPSPLITSDDCKVGAGTAEGVGGAQFFAIDVHLGEVRHAPHQHCRGALRRADRSVLRTAHGFPAISASLQSDHCCALSRRTGCLAGCLAGFATGTSTVRVWRFARRRAGPGLFTQQRVEWHSRADHAAGSCVQTANPSFPRRVPRGHEGGSLRRQNHAAHWNRARR